MEDGEVQDNTTEAGSEATICSQKTKKTSSMEARIGSIESDVFSSEFGLPDECQKEKEAR